MTLHTWTFLIQGEEGRLHIHPSLSQELDDIDPSLSVSPSPWEATLAPQQLPPGTNHLQMLPPAATPSSRSPKRTLSKLWPYGCVCLCLFCFTEHYNLTWVVSSLKSMTPCNLRIPTLSWHQEPPTVGHFLQLLIFCIPFLCILAGIHAIPSAYNTCSCPLLWVNTVHHSVFF